MNTTPLTGKPLQQPDPAPLRVFAIFNSDQPCVEHSVAFRGKIPCTGPLICWLCGTTWNPDSGELEGN